MAYSVCSALVRHAVARVVASIAEIELRLGNWPSLLPSLLQTATSSVVAQRETGAFALCTILERTDMEIQEQLPSFCKLFSSLAHHTGSLDPNYIVSFVEVQLSSGLLVLIEHKQDSWYPSRKTLVQRRRMPSCVWSIILVVRTDVWLSENTKRSTEHDRCTQRSYRGWR